MPPLAPRDAALHILTDLRRQPALRVPLDDALDGVLAETVISPLDIPAWANSAMDGYAVRA
ncbi:MAG: molybdopterin molybdenumtransferase MoeA, partial [Gemmatimonadota bacterium]|nr:molybdopterin molybdenumtransferase MoeA [Gemmatimonadota bacterium]